MEESQDEPVTSTAQTTLLSLPPTTSLAALQDECSDTQESQDTQDAQDTQDNDTRDALEEVDAGSTQESLVPQPLAVKPVYKKRVVVSSARPDGIIRRSGTQAAIEKQMVVKRRPNRQSGSKVSVYEDSQDLSPSVQDPSTSTRERDPPPLKSPTKRKAPAEAKQRLKKPRPPPVIWKPRSMEDEGQPPPPPQTTKNEFDREAYLKFLLRHQTAQRDRIAHLTSRPLPLQDLQALVQAELEHEEIALRELGIRLYREYLKLQLEEGVLSNMLYVTRNGVLDVEDLEKVKVLRKYTKRRPRSPSTIRARPRTSRTGSPTPSTSLATSTVGSPTSISYLESMDIEVEGERNVDDEGEDGEEDDVDDNESDVEGFDAGRPIYQAPGESYSMPSIDHSSPSGAETVGRPEASIRKPGLDGEYSRWSFSFA